MSLYEKPNTPIVKSEFGILEYLKYIPMLVEQNIELLEKVRLLEDKLIPKYDLTKREGVKQYLEICETTLNKMMNDGRLKQEIHFKKEIKGSRTKITFIESAILDFKEKYK